MYAALEADKGPVAAFGLPAAHKSHIAAALSTRRPLLFVSATELGARQAFLDMRALGANAALFPLRETPLVHVAAVSPERAAERIGVMTRLLLGERLAVCASMAALMQLAAPPEAFLAGIRRLRTGDALDPRALMAALLEAGYERVELIEGRGQAAARGDLVDVFPPQAEYPVRIEFFGDEIDQMRLFDPLSQRALAQTGEALIPPAMETPQPRARVERALRAVEGRPGLFSQAQAWAEGRPAAGAEALLPLLYEERATLCDYLPAESLVLLDETQRLDEAARTEQARFSEQVSAMLERGEGLAQQGRLMIGAEEAMQRLRGGRSLQLYTLLRAHNAYPAAELAQFAARSAPQYLGSISELALDLGRWKAAGEAVLLYAGDRAESLCGELRENGAEPALAEALLRAPQPGEALVLKQSLPRGFSYPEQRLQVLGAQEIFGRSEGRKPAGRRRQGLRFSELSAGDYIVHEAYGVGRFVRIETLTVQDSTRDYLLLEYRGGDRLYIPTDQLDRVQKYVGGAEDEAVTLSKLGGSEWANRVGSAKAAAKKLAVDLAAIYAERTGGAGFAFSPDTDWQRSFEERFPYEETPDQLQCIAEIKADMEKPRPMDRLLCGDVGYGKTEVALRAAFKAVQDGKQVAMLVPTTILAQQHYATIESRFKDFAVKTACLSRFRTPQERRAILEGLKDGRLDVVVGTHALLAGEVAFKDLGLLIIDEEHRFGVNHKEKLKALRRSVDVLTLTATPIPRTLNMSMTGIRDISVIETPPEERYPVQTYVLEYTDALLADALSRELARGGQSYVVYNRVQSMEAMRRRIEKLVPDARVLMAHGQMDERLLERVMLDFFEQRADVLLCSTIIESGLDIPNANTLVVLDADRMGLAQLYQLRGRVGRSNRLGYAYLTVQQSRALNDAAHRRLMAIREFTQFGAGFQLALRDLEIRGAGSLLGAEQHGHIHDIGYEYYCKLMRQAVREARGEATASETETSVEMPLDAHIPRDYIASEAQRLYMYRRIGGIDGEEALGDVREELIDRYGEPPEPVENLMLTALIKARAARSMIDQVALRDGEASLRFAEDAQLDGGRLIAALGGMPGAVLTAASPVCIRIRRKDVAVKAIAEILPQFLFTIMHCVDRPEGI
ncbi:MAG: transcription-repair coupling factor [Clostridia bacterium]|nr:transcription-repair coupling factor [Clostridia bacterium]